LGLYCDIVVAAEERRYGLNFSDMGFTPGMGSTSLLPGLVGHYFASEVLLTGKFYKGKELKDRRLFNYVVPSRDVRRVSTDIAERISEKPKHVLQMIKETLALPRLRDLQTALSREHLMHVICFNKKETMKRIEETYIEGKKDE